MFYHKMLLVLLFLTFSILVLLATIILYLAINVNINYLIYIIIVLFILFSSLIRLIEHLSVITKTKNTTTTEFKKIDGFSIIIAAYLPTEQYLILDTIEYFLSLNLPLEIILTYNTPNYLAIEDDLKKLPILVVKVPNSKSKAENINFILEQIKSKYTAVFDADHRPLISNFGKALSTLTRGYDIVQGSCLPLTQSPLGNFLNVEFNQIYNIHHQARQKLWDFAIFGGSNGYFKTEVLKKISFNHNMLTEDIDLTVRALLSGYKIAFDSTIVSYEQAPNNLQELWKQRTRWAQGWLQVSWKYAGQILFTSEQLSLRQKLGLLMLFPFREIEQLIVLQVLPLAISISIQRHDWNWSNTWLFVFMINLSLLMIEPLWIFRVRDQESVSKKWFFLYALLSFFYLSFLKIISLYAYFRQGLKNNDFEVTQKSPEILKA